MDAPFFGSIDADINGLVRRQLPAPQDAQIGDLLEAWSRLGKKERAESCQSLSYHQSLVLLGYSERAASLAVRQNRAHLIFLGLLALGVDDWRFDYRDNLVRVALHYDAALRLDVNPQAVFERAASLLEPTAARGLRAFLQRRPEDQSLKVMGSLAGTDEGGFRYLDAPFEPLSEADRERYRRQRADAPISTKHPSFPPEGLPWKIMRLVAGAAVFCLVIFEIWSLFAPPR